MSTTGIDWITINKCNHIKLDNQCNLCNAAYFEESGDFSLKLSKFNSFNEVCSFSLLENMIEANKKMVLKPFIEDSENRIHMVYFQIRKDLFRLIKDYVLNMKFKSQTYFLACLLLDNVFEKIKHSDVISTNKNQVLKEFECFSIACLIISAKYEENDPNVPSLHQFENIVKLKYFPINTLKKAEVSVLHILDHNISYYSIYHFVSIFLSLGILFNDDYKEEKSIIKVIEEEGIDDQRDEVEVNEDDILKETFKESIIKCSIKDIELSEVKKIIENITTYSKSIIDVIINDSSSINYSCFTLASGILYYSRQRYSIIPWNEKFIKYGFKLESIQSSALPFIEKTLFEAKQLKPKQHKSSCDIQKYKNNYDSPPAFLYNNISSNLQYNSIGINKYNNNRESHKSTSKITLETNKEKEDNVLKHQPSININMNININPPMTELNFNYKYSSNSENNIEPSNTKKDSDLLYKTRKLFQKPDLNKEAPSSKRLFNFDYSNLKPEPSSIYESLNKTKSNLDKELNSHYSIMNKNDYKPRDLFSSKILSENDNFYYPKKYSDQISSSHLSINKIPNYRTQTNSFSTKTSTIYSSSSNLYNSNHYENNTNSSSNLFYSFSYKK
jgi:hypothetical protein